MVESGQIPEAPKTGVEGIIDAVADLLQTVVDWLRQEAAAVVREKVVLPVQRLGLTLASAVAAGALLVFGLMFIAVALFLLLAEWVSYPGALLIIGGVYVLVSLVFLVIKVRLIQK
ncbi:MAG: phage holin family protein [Coriobacteriia bacterium]|nr:phage holin family protein [Coriobacteriia bacterium]